ncbi:MAG: acyl-CoA thioesterase [Planctomycetes bacterium]|nr:acyl-CoA thioesterase [Planctomycetota bacterium]
MSEPEPTLSLRRVAHPSDANHQGTVFGGFILSLIDEAAYLEVRRHGVHRWVTVSMDRVEFKAPVRVGDVVSLFTHASQMGRSSRAGARAGGTLAGRWPRGCDGGHGEDGGGESRRPVDRLPQRTHGGG